MQKKELSIIVKHLPIIGMALIIWGVIYYLTSNTSAIAKGGTAFIAAHLILIGFAAYLGRKLFNKGASKKNSEVFD